MSDLFITLADEPVQNQLPAGNTVKGYF